MKLCQVNALVQGKKSETTKVVTDLYKVLQKPDLFDGRQRVYRPLDEDQGEKLPTELQKVQQQTCNLLDQARVRWVELWDLVFTQDQGNQQARADILVQGQVILSQVPVTSLLFLEKQLTDLETFLSHLPVPDPAYDWSLDPNTDLLRTRELESVRTKKVPRNHVKAAATDKFPAQVEVYMEDVSVGRWLQTLFTGRVPARDKNHYLERVKALKEAVKVAREEANLAVVEPVKVANRLFDFILGT